MFLKRVCVKEKGCIFLRICAQLDQTSGEDKIIFERGGQGIIFKENIQPC